ncbi:MAG: hypothetical protein QME32_02800 [Endomicrobiia bacterium]|nr:hypothetical protein [Endomicrobiia bacterium]
MKYDFRLAGFLAVVFLAAASSPAVPSLSAWEVIDVPTTESVDYATYRLSFRLYTDGGVLTRTTFGVFRNVNMGFAWDIKNIIGSRDLELVPPSMHLKIRFYEGDKKFPSFALGYDGQGYHWDKPKQIYLEKERGIYAVLSREFLTPGLDISLGCNVNDFKNTLAYGFIGAVYTVEKVSILAEYDNLHIEEYQRLNAGLRFEVTPDLRFELSGRNIGRNFPAERIIKANYVARF